MQIWFWLLLPIAAASGWWAAQYSHAKKHATSKAVLNSAYGRGLNYLLNEEPDKATEVLIQLVEVDPDTIELHLALGSLFRRRGEIDRAIRVHQNVVARSMLSHSLRAQATLELGRDFLKAGLLDRAEQLFCQLLERGECETEARQHLVEVYQQEKEWEKAIAVARHLVQLDADGWAPRMAQYYCELAEDALEQGETAVALQRAGEALSEDPGCVRATLVKGRLLMDEGQYQAALDSYTAVEQQNPALMPEVVDQIHTCYTRLGDEKGWVRYIENLVNRHSELVFSDENIVEVKMQRLIERRPRYLCGKCGFASRKLFWRCPGCQTWSSAKPIRAGHTE